MKKTNKTKNKNKASRKNEDYEIKFWKDWLEADLIRKEKLVGGLPIIRDLEHLNKLPPKLRKHIFTLSLNSFFKDLTDAVHTKIRLENGKF